MLPSGVLSSLSSLEMAEVGVLLAVGEGSWTDRVHNQLVLVEVVVAHLALHGRNSEIEHTVRTTEYINTG